MSNRKTVFNVRDYGAKGDGNASETIDGATTKTLTTQHAAISIVSNGTNWVITNQMGTIT